MNWFDAVLMTAGLPLCIVLALIFCVSVFFVFLPAVLGVAVTLERLCDVAAAVRRRVSGPRET